MKLFNMLYAFEAVVHVITESVKHKQVLEGREGNIPN